jgi:hypothetical protein
MLNLLGYTFTVLAAWSAIDHEYVAPGPSRSRRSPPPSPSPSRRRAEMTIARYVDIAQRPDRHTVEELTAAMEYWHGKAMSAEFGQGGDAAMRYQLCLVALMDRNAA